MTHGKYPFFPTGLNKRQELEDMVSERRLVFDNPNISQECKQFIDKTLQTDPAKRITFFDMFDEPWLQQCQKEDFNQSVINLHLQPLTYKEVHINQDFAIQFGITLRNYVDEIFKQHCSLLENAYLKFNNKTNSTPQEKKVVYLLNLLITKICSMNIEFNFKDKAKVYQIPLTENSIQMFKSIISEDNFKKSKAICDSSSIDFTPLLQTLNTSLLQIAQHELQQMDLIENYKKEFEKVITLIELLTDNRFGLPISISVDVQNSNPKNIEQIENISIKEAYIDIEYEDENYINEVLETKILTFNCISKNIFQLPGEKDNLENIKQILGLLSH